MAKESYRTKYYGEGNVHFLMVSVPKRNPGIILFKHMLTKKYRMMNFNKKVKRLATVHLF